MVRDQWHTSGLLWGILIVAGVLVLMIGLHRGQASFVKYWELSEDGSRLETEIAKLESEIGRTEEEIEHIRTSPDYAKKVLQEKYNHLEPGERIQFVPDSDTSEM